MDSKNKLLFNLLTYQVSRGSKNNDIFLFVFQAAKKFRRYWSIIFYIISIIMNTLSFLVMTMKHNRHLSTCVYMSIIALNDNVVLSVNFHRWLEENTGFHVLTNSGCKIIIYLVHVVGSTGAFEIVLMTLDKVIAIKMPHKSAVLCTARRAKYFQLSTCSQWRFSTCPT